MAKPKQVDWEAISREYRAGIRSLRNIGDEYGVTEGAIRKRAKAEEWPRDLSEKIQAKAKDLVRKEMVRSGTIGTKEQDVIDGNADMVAGKYMSHLNGLSKLQKVCDDLTEELVSQSISREELAEIAEIMVLRQTQDGDQPDPKDVQRRLDSFMKLLELSNRSDTFKKLVESKTKLITLERTVLGMDKDNNKGQSLGEFLESLT